MDHSTGALVIQRYKIHIFPFIVGKPNEEPNQYYMTQADNYTKHLVENVI